MDLGLSGRVAIITGGSEGIGKATAYRLAQEGARVAICARRRTVLEAAADEVRRGTEGQVLPVVADVSRPDDVKRLVQTVAAEWGGVDILVNNAGTSATGPFQELGDEGWMADLDLKLFGAIRCIREVLPYMKQQRWGRVVNLTNLAGRAPGTRSVPTSVTRAAGIALTKALSKEFAPDNILVNTVCIGVVKAGQHESRYQRARAQHPELTLDQFYEQMAQRAGVPLGRVGEAQEAADVIAFLVSERASYITGVAINIDGGTSPVV
jgi:NAD(P)-dependent dehydrogenase (short-subunit alcohol dehydrogenase family)